MIHEFDALIMKAQKRLNEGLKEVRTLLKDLAEQVKDLVKIYRDNYLLPRFILENETVVHRDVREEGLPGPA